MRQPNYISGVAIVIALFCFQDAASQGVAETFFPYTVGDSVAIDRYHAIWLPDSVELAGRQYAVVYGISGRPLPDTLRVDTDAVIRYSRGEEQGFGDASEEG